MIAKRIWLPFIFLATEKQTIHQTALQREIFGKLEKRKYAKAFVKERQQYTQNNSDQSFFYSNNICLSKTPLKRLIHQLGAKY